MKKIKIILVAAVFAITMAGCSDSSQEVKDLQTQVAELTDRLEQAEELLEIQDDINSGTLEAIQSIIDILNLL